MTGPCMCGDPYCPSCGDPSRAEFEGFVDQLMDYLSGLDDIEARLFDSSGRAAVSALREAQSRAKSDGEWTHDWNTEDGGKKP